MSRDETGTATMDTHFTPFDLDLRDGRAVAEPNVGRLREVLASLPRTGLGITATVPADDGFGIVGSALFLIGPNPGSCEFSTTVLAEYGGLGLGGALMTALIAAARQRGLHEMKGYVLARNQPMLRLATRLGFSIRPDPDDFSIRICRLHLADT